MKNIRLAVIGLGYVGLPLAVEFAKKRNVIGYDINSGRISELKDGIDSTNEVSTKELKASKKITYTDSISDISECNFFIVTVPTPITRNKKPDLTFLKNASKVISKILKRGDFVVFESTVYPGATREICIPELEKFSSLTLNKDFFVGYSPERINPGDKNHRIGDIRKIVAGSNDYSAKIINKLYSSIITAGTHLVSSIEIAEAAKVIENTQRDLNIALINELSLIFNQMNLNTEEIIEAASTKWNFAKFLPGFVGGHCIGVDPYYLTYQSKRFGYNPRVILSGRSLNDDMPKIIAKRIKDKLSTKKINKILLMGFSFKENCPDIRNTKIADLAEQLILTTSNRQNKIEIFDPVIDISSAQINYPTIKFISNPKNNFYDAVVITVGHNLFKQIGSKEIRKYLNSNGELWDLKYLFDESLSDHRL